MYKIFLLSCSLAKRLIGNEYLWLILYAFLLLPSYLVSELKSSLDSSWAISLDLAVNNKLVFGKDFCFTYGPLGFLYTKQILAHSKWLLLAFDVLIIVLSTIALRKALNTIKCNFYISSAIAAVLFCIAPTELTFMLPPLFFIILILFLDTRKIIYIYLAVLLSVISFYVKVNYGFVLYLILYVFLFFTLISKIIKPLELIQVIVVHLTATSVLAYVLNVDIIGYATAGKYLIDSYNDAMVINVEWNNAFLLSALLMLLLFIFGLLYCLYNSLFSAHILVGFFLVSTYSYLLFKNGFVRSDGHMMSFFRLFPFSFGIISLFVLKGKSKIWAYLSISSVLISISSVVLMKIYQPIQISNQIRNQSYMMPKNEKRKVNYIEKFLKIKYFKQILTDDYQNNSEFIKSSVAKLNASFIDKIARGSTDVIPTEISIIQKYNLNYRPRPVIQSYSAYNSSLDNLNYNKYQSKNAPQFIIYQNTHIDNRVPYWDESATMRAVLGNYKIIDSDSTFLCDYSYTDSTSKAKLLLLARMKEPFSQRRIKTDTLQLNINKPLIIEKSNTLQYLYADIEYSFIGKLKRFLFQPPIIDVLFTYDDGTNKKFQAIVPILKTGVLVNKRVINTDEAALLMKSKGKDNPNITSITFTSGEEFGFTPTINARIEEIKIQ